MITAIGGTRWKPGSPSWMGYISVMQILIAQCLCGPNRHAMLALALQPQDAGEHAIELLQACVQAVLDGEGEQLGLPPKMNPWCGICGSREWTYEVGWSKEYESWGAATLDLRESERNQQATAQFLRLLATVGPVSQREH